METALLLCIVAIALAVFVPTFARRMRTNKISEASELLQEMSDRSAAYYAASRNTGASHCLPPKAGPTPALASVDSNAVDFFADEQVGHTTWEALGFQPDRPIRYSYSYTPSRDGCDLGSGDDVVSISFRAEGDLDGDGVRSVFERRATVDTTGFHPADTLHVHQRVE